MTSDFRESAMAEIGARLSPVLSRLERVTKADELSAWDASYKLPSREFPYSCTTEEGLALYYIVKANGLRSGYEIATAFGVSSLYLALALQANRGSLLSIDCYVEETKESFHYTDEEIQRHVVALHQRMADGHVPVGLAFAREAAAMGGLTETATFGIGVSPNDVPALLKERSVDVALIDGGHFGDQPTKDFEVLLPFLGQKCAVFFHDNNGNESVARAVQAAARSLGVESLTLNTYYSLTLVSRGLDPETVAAVKSLRARPTPAAPRRTLRGVIASLLRRLR